MAFIDCIERTIDTKTTATVNAQHRVAYCEFFGSLFLRSRVSPARFLIGRA
jgi:hypothetical protein